MIPRDPPRWSTVATIEHPRGAARAARAKIGTAFHTLPTAKQRAHGVERGHGLYVKIGDDAWLCYQGASIEDCLARRERDPAAGGPASDYLVGNAISSVTRAGHVTTVCTAHLGTPTSRARPLTARVPAPELWRRLEQRGATVVRRKVTEKAIAAAERALRFAFPPSYRALVADGAPAIGRDPKAPADALSYAVLVPSEVVTFTRELRDSLEPDMFEDPASLPRVRTQLANAVWFQLGADAGEGFVFLLDTRDRAGEMRIGDYSHDYLEELDWSRKSRVVYRSLAAATAHAAERIARYLPG